MSTDPTTQQTKVKEFLQLLPLTIEIAGLPVIETGRHLNADQMEVRANSIRTAYKIARQLVIDVSQ
jgi:hypothetical protein